MHRVLAPSRSGVHRFACEMIIFHCECPLANTTLSAGLALYRALLRQCTPSVAGDALCRDETKFLVKQKFRKYKRLQSPSQIANALRAGYEVRMGKLYPDIFTILMSRCLDTGSGLARPCMQWKSTRFPQAHNHTFPDKVIQGAKCT